MADLPLLENKRFVVLALLSIVSLVSVPFLDAVFHSDDPTGHGTLKKWKKKAKSTWQKSGIEKVDDKAKAEAERTAKRLKEEAERSKEKIEAEAKRLEERTKAEAGRFGKRVNAEWGRFDDRVGNELERFSERVEAEVNRIPDNIKKLGDKAEAEYKRFLEKIKKELETQKTVFKNLAKGKICDAYQQAQKSDAYDVKKWIYDTLMPPIKNVLRPHVATLVTQIAAPLNAIPLVGNVLYAMAVNPATIEKLTENAAKKAIREALEECK